MPSLNYLAQHWPQWFRPEPIEFEARRFGPFERCKALTRAGDVVIVPTPGHTPHHISVIVDCGDVTVFLAGDATYFEAQLLGRWADGVSPQPEVQLRTLDTIKWFVQSRPTVYLPSHDRESAKRLEAKQVTLV